ncbi:TonB family protein [Chitinophaga niastensis]|uniref:TonB family protein n=1 Tax=Chitinophaga niastensis TaxID=536980 RepID=A0A2P8HNC0_CHINA|nr:M56 family metallopeptidase [Chitinophaga niastensis]PSL47714.1 TonB family protein [Chitinophaga niastensis]
MIALLTYLSKVILCSAVLYGYYFIALRNNRFHQWNRYYLVLITLVSLLTPLLQIPLPFQQTEPSAVLSYTARIITLRETVIPPVAQVINFRIVITVIYMAIILLLLIRLLVSLVKIRRLIRHSTIQEVPPYRFVKNQEITAPFSFFTYIFWDQHTPLNSPEGQQILKHELVHLQEKHSTDKLFMEIVTAICWINPFFHLMKRELALVHEFLADKKAAGGEVAGYAQTILQIAFQSKQFSITNNFFHPPIKRRILMLTQFHTPRFSYLRRILVLPLAAFIFCSLAFVADKRPSAIRALSANSSNIRLQKDKAVVRDSIPAAKQDSVDNEVFVVVDQPPTYKGGEEALVIYLAHSIHYPKAARKNRTSGTIFVGFVVEKTGKISHVKIINQDPGDGLGEEALRVVNCMPNWIPGTQKGERVAVQYSLPIRFAVE